MLRHIYDLPLIIDIPPHRTTGLFVNLFLLADKYDVPSLRLLCISDLKDDHLSCEDFRSVYFFGTLQTCFSSEQADSSLKETLSKRITPYMTTMMKEPGFAEVLKKAPDLAVQLLSTIYAGPDEFVSHCWPCGNRQIWIQTEVFRQGCQSCATAPWSVEKV